MNKFVIALAVGGGVIVAAIVVALASGVVKFNFGGNVTVCRSNDEIGQSTRAEIEQAVSRDIEAFINRDIDAFFNSLSDDAKKGVSVAWLRNLSDRVVADAGAFEKLVVTRVHMVEGVVTGISRAVCGLGRKPDDLSVVVAPLRRQAYVIAVVHAAHKDLTFTFWLDGDNGWKTIYFFVELARIGGKSADDMLAWARDQKKLGNNFNAALLYRSAINLLTLGPNMQYQRLSEVKSEAASLSLPREFEGPFPVNWRVGERDYSVTYLGASDRDRKLYLTIVYQAGAALSDADVEKQNAELMPYVENRLPEHAGVFDGIIVMALDASGNKRSELLKPVVK